MNCHNPLADSDKYQQMVDLPENVPPLVTFYLYLTNSCNLSCRHCWITPEKCSDPSKVPDSMDLDHLKRAIREAKPIGLASVKLTGGEPLLHPQFCEIIELLNAENLNVIIETNGTLVTDRIVECLKNNIPDCFISVSLDSADSTKHDAFRGLNGAFSSAVSGIKKLVEASFNPQVIMSVHRGNLHEVEALIEYASSIGVGSVKFNPVTNSGRGSKMGEQGELLSYDDFMAFKGYVLGELQRMYQVPLYIMMPPALVTIPEILNRPFGFGRCNILGILGILGTGEMALCGIGRNFPDLCFGKLGSDSIREVWFNNPVLNEIRDIVFNDKYPGICGNCIHARECLMLCMAQNYLDFGTIAHPAALCCEAEKRGEFPVTRTIDME